MDMKGLLNKLDSLSQHVEEKSTVIHENKLRQYLNILTEEQSEENPTDTVTMDIPLLIRLLEYAREDAKSDVDLHSVTENMIGMSGQNKILTMDDYDAIVNQPTSQDW